MRRSNFGEADRLLTIFTDRYGKLRAVAKGVRRPAAKLTGSLELFYRSKLRLAEGKNLDIVIESTPFELNRTIAEDLERFHVATYLAELVDKTTHDGQSHPEIYRLLSGGLAAVNHQDWPGPQPLADYFTAKLLVDLGYKPVVDRCAVAGEPLQSSKNGWSVAQGGVVCWSHRPADGIAISDNVVKLLRLVIAKPLAALLKIKVTQDVSGQFHRIISDFFNYHFDVPLKSRKYVDVA